MTLTTRLESAALEEAENPTLLDTAETPEFQAEENLSQETLEISQEDMASIYKAGYRLKPQDVYRGTNGTYWIAEVPAEMYAAITGATQVEQDLNFVQFRRIAPTGRVTGEVISQKDFEETHGEAEYTPFGPSDLEELGWGKWPEWKPTTDNTPILVNLARKGVLSDRVITAEQEHKKVEANRIGLDKKIKEKSQDVKEGDIVYQATSY